jgi:flagellar motility protein MotE (MotC chaperone)
VSQLSKHLKLNDLKRKKARLEKALKDDENKLILNTLNAAKAKQEKDLARTNEQIKTVKARMYWHAKQIERI